MEKRRVFARIDTSESISSNGSSSDQARKGNSSSPSFGVTARARMIPASSSNNIKVAGSSTPTSTSASSGARVIHATPSSFSSSSPGGMSVASGGGGGIKARVLGYNNQQHQDGSPLASSNVRTPPTTSAATVSASPNFVNNNNTRSLDRRVRGGSTEPTDSPTASVYARRVNAGPSTTFPSSASTARLQQPSPITAPVNAGVRRPARAADPLKASITSRPHAAAAHVLLPAAKLSCSPSSSAAVFGASTSARIPGGVQANQRPSSPIRRPASPVRPASPLRVQTSPARSTTPLPPSSPMRRTHSTVLPQQSPSSLALKRPSTSSQSSSSTASTSMSLSPEIFSDSAKTVTRPIYHRTRRRSQSLSSSTSSISNVSVCEAAKRESREIKMSVPLQALLATPPAREVTLEEKIQRDAKVNRKILDLEITNTSLLAINSTLERTKVKQAQEIRLLRRRMRDQSILPQHLGAMGSGGSIPPLLSPISDDFSWGSGGLEEEEQEELEWEEVLRRDTHFADVVSKLESLNRRAKEAIEKPVNMGGRVLNPLFEPEANSRPANPHSSRAGDHSRETSSSTTDNDEEEESKDGDETSMSISIDMSIDLSNSTRSSSAATSSPEISISHISSLSSID